MQTLLPRILKWALSVFFLIIGLQFLTMSKLSGHPGPIILAIFSFGLVYWMYKSFAEIPWQVGAATLAMMLAGAGAAYYLPVNNFPFNFDFFIDWAAWTTLAGAPVIGYVYHKYK